MEHTSMALTMKSLVSFEVKREDRVYSFIMSTGAPAGEVYDVLMECIKKVVQVSNENVQAMERKTENSKEIAS